LEFAVLLKLKIQKGLAQIAAKFIVFIAINVLIAELFWSIEQRIRAPLITDLIGKAGRKGSAAYEIP
jgi:hypothetical protein